MTATTRELCMKVLSSLHLSVPERQMLPGGRAPFAEMLMAVKKHLDTTGWFPRPMRPDGMIGESAVLELRGDEVWVHEPHEIGVRRYSSVQSRKAPDLAQAVRAYIRAQGGEPIDGVPVDW